VRLWLVLLAALVPLVPVGIGAFALSGGSAGAASGTMRPVSAPPAPPPSATAELARRNPPWLSRVVVVRRATVLRAAPGGAVLASQPVRTPFGSPVVMLVRRSRPGWFGVLSPNVGNGRLGWIQRSAVSVGTVSWKIEVSLAARRVTVLENGKVVRRWPVAIGRPSAPTPTGEFAVTDLLKTGDPGGPYGCCIVALSALAPHPIPDWSGGNRIALHSTPETSTVGEAVSHGCLRMYPADAQWLLRRVPLGTPTLISSS
jgi:hypothetical protein